MHQKGNVKDELALVPRPEPFVGLNIEGLLEKAIDAKSAVEVMERLQVMRREMRAEHAEEEFNSALSAFQSECPIITKEKAVPTASGKVAYKYAPIEAIEVQIRPVEQRHGFNHTFDTDISSQQGWVIAKCCITHRAGHSRVSTAKFPLGTKTQVMSDTQVYSAALTFANRRVLCNAYGLVLAGEDLDAASGRIKPQGPSVLQPSEPKLRSLAQELWDILKTVRGAEKNWKAANQFLWDECVLGDQEIAPELSPDRFKEVIETCKKKLAK